MWNEIDSLPEYNACHKHNNFYEPNELEKQQQTFDLFRTYFIYINIFKLTTSMILIKKFCVLFITDAQKLYDNHISSAKLVKITYMFICEIE